jgi:hypothetical protein
MRRIILTLTCCLAFIFTGISAPARAAGGSGEPSKPEAQAPPAQTVTTTLDHRFQVGLGVRVGTGYRVIAPYDKEFCGEKDDSGNPKSVCGQRLPFFLELSPSFGITTSLELLVDIRLYLEEDFTGTNAFFVAPGLKYYMDPESWFKFYGTAQIVFENQEQLSDNIPSFDIGGRFALGVHFDIVRYVGLYVQGGIIGSFNRWLSFVVDFAGGLQVRY